ncbi:tyrosine-type recombinase/integrase [Kitasatospora sp. NPDC096140]|uniref:tyrosine-type recombinase/integrase n=1 Tax=Kitasatospora sp. NPDC096140 TaxID=3155425 RepID=UPI00331A6EA0
MAVHPDRGRIFRRCGCRDAVGKQFGARCPSLDHSTRHGSWAYAFDVPSTGGRRRQRCRSGFRTRRAAREALERALECERTGLDLDDDLTVAGYLTDWLRTKEDVLKPTTYARYRDHVHNDLIPAFGRLKLSDLRERHITAWTEAELARGRGRTSVYRAGATLSSALNTAVRTRRLADNPARYAVMLRPAAPERICWMPSQAAAFLRHNHDAYGDQLADAFEALLGTGMRRGELLGLHWPEVHLAEQVLLVRWNLTAVDNNHLHLGYPKTKASRNWVSLSARVVAALERRATAARAALPEGAPLEGLVFCQPDGAPLRPQQLLVTLRRRSAEIGLPRIGVHDLRHTAASIMISSKVPLAVVSKTLRHSTLSTTVNIYGHLLPHAARDAVTALCQALDDASPPSAIPGNGALAISDAA